MEKHVDRGALRERVHRIDVAAANAEIGDAARDAHARLNVDNLGADRYRNARMLAFVDGFGDCGRC